MNANEEIWRAINQTPGIAEETKKALHVRIMRIVEQARHTPVGKKLGVTFMTQESSLAGDKTAQDRTAKGSPGEQKPKSV